MKPTNVLNISKYIINYCIEKNIDMYTLKLQRLLFLSWIDYYNKTGDYLFESTFKANEYGPYNIDIALEYNGFPWYEIQDNAKKNYNPDCLDAIIKESLDKTLNSYAGKSFTEIQTIICKDHNAWSIITNDIDFTNTKQSAYHSSYHHDKDIPFDLIIKNDCESIK